MLQIFEWLFFITTLPFTVALHTLAIVVDRLNTLLYISVNRYKQLWRVPCNNVIECVIDLENKWRFGIEKD